MTGLATTSARSPKSYESSGHTSYLQSCQIQIGRSQELPKLQYTPAVMVPSTAALTPSTECSNSTGYFGLVADADAVHTQHSRINWSPAGSSIRSAAARSPLPVHLDNPSTPFQLQAEALAQKLQNSSTTRKLEARSNIPGDVSTTPDVAAVTDKILASIRTTSSLSITDANEERWRGESASASTSCIPRSKSLVRGIPNASTLPLTPQNGPASITSSQLSDFLGRNSTSQLLLLDVRTYKLFAESRIKTAVNLCIPTTLLKRPSFNVTKLSETFANERDKGKFEKWKDMKWIVVYDADSEDINDSSGVAALHTLSKFSREGWMGRAYMLKGGYKSFSTIYPNFIDRTPLINKTPPTKNVAFGNSSQEIQPAAGGVFNCPLPVQQSIVNPFFSNIRQNLDLVGGVGEIPISLPKTMGPATISHLPKWLREVCDDGASKIVADRFLKIERAEQRRMQEALNVSVTYDSPTSTRIKPHTLAGVEKGAKNRYNNVWPYDHARVKLQEYPTEGCDYVNASHIQSKYAQKRYIAAQAPLPATFRDFWSMVWEQDVRVIVMLTAEEEGGRLKSHNYWKTNLYGALRLNCLQERKVSLEPSLEKGSPKRRSVTSSGNVTMTTATDSSVPFVHVRKFTLEHTARPFSPIREITQLQYCSWPDLGIPAHPSHVLSLVEHVESVVRSALSPDILPNRRPVLVHCSAGCGRTGTFCTADSVIAMIKRQRSYGKRHTQEDTPESDAWSNMNMHQLELDDDWIRCEDEDLVFKVVSEFRDQRISMVQCLQQYVLCYETVLEWLLKQSLLGSGKRKALV